MKTVKSTKKVTPNVVTEKSQDLATIKIVKEISRDKKTKEKGFIYKFQLAEKKLSAKEAKRLRGKLRRQLQSIANDIIVDKTKDKKLIKTFIDFYKENYILNDFSLQSLTNSSDELKHDDLNRVLKAVKESKEK